MASLLTSVRLCSTPVCRQLLKNILRSRTSGLNINKAFLSTFIPENYQKMYSLETWSHEVHPYGKLNVSVPFNIRIIPLDAVEYPFMDKAFVTLYADKEKGHEIVDVMQWNSFYDCHIGLKTHERELDFTGVITPDGHEYFKGIVPLECLIQIPIKFGLSLHMTEQGNVEVADMESHDVHITATKGDCVLRDIKSGSIHVHNWGGNIICQNSVLANMELKTSGTGAIKADKLQGEHIKVRTENGDIKTKAIYAADANFWCHKGEIRLGSCHGNIVVDVKEGRIFIDTLDGNLNARVTKGYVEGHVSRFDKVAVKNGDGNIRLQLSDTLEANLELVGSTVTVNPELTVYEAEEHNAPEGRRIYKGKLNGGHKHSLVCDTTQGNIVLEAVDWFNSLKLEK